MDNLLQGKIACCSTKIVHALRYAMSIYFNEQRQMFNNADDNTSEWKRCLLCMHWMADARVCLPMRMSISDAWLRHDRFRSGQLLEIALNRSSRSSRRVNSSRQTVDMPIRERSWKRGRLDKKIRDKRELIVSYTWKKICCSKIRFSRGDIVSWLAWMEGSSGRSKNK